MRNKLLAIVIISAVVILSGILLFSMPSKENETATETSNTPSSTSLFIAANKALRDRFGTSIPYDRPMQLEDDIKNYNDGWFTATITLLDENPKKHSRTMICVFKESNQGIKVIDFQPKGWFMAEDLLNNAPAKLIEDINWEPDRDL